MKNYHNFLTGSLLCCLLGRIHPQIHFSHPSDNSQADKVKPSRLEIIVKAKRKYEMYVCVLQEEDIAAFPAQ